MKKHGATDRSLPPDCRLSLLVLRLRLGTEKEVNYERGLITGMIEVSRSFRDGRTLLVSHTLRKHSRGSEFLWSLQHLWLLHQEMDLSEKTLFQKTSLPTPTQQNSKVPGTLQNKRTSRQPMDSSEAFALVCLLAWRAFLCAMCTSLMLPRRWSRSAQMLNHWILATTKVVVCHCLTIELETWALRRTIPRERGHQYCGGGGGGVDYFGCLARSRFFLSNDERGKHKPKQIKQIASFPGCHLVTRHPVRRFHRGIL